MRRMLAGAAAGCVLLGLAATDPSLASPTTTRTVITPDGPIEHVVVIYQENHTFDDVLGGLCQVRSNPCDGYSGPVTFRDGIRAENVVQGDQVPFVDHNPSAQRVAMHNNWDQVGGCTTPPYLCVSHVDPVNMQNLTRLANTYTVSDRTFATGRATSFGAHVTLGGGTLAGFRGWNPVESRTGVKPRDGWGCYSRRDSKWGPIGHLSYQPSCIPDKKGNGAYRPTKVPYGPTIMERMEQAGLTWHIYEGDSATEPTLTSWSVCSYYAWCWRHRWDLEHESSRYDFIDTALAGDLPNLSILLPTGNISQHNGTSMINGDNYIGAMVQAVMDGPDWDSTAIFITYDDCGCFYDHVQPPQGLGFRNPMVIVSPYAKPVGTDSQVAIQPYSALAFTQHVFGLAPLSKGVSHAYDYADSFDFNQEPLPGVRMTFKRVPAWELPLLAKAQPLVEDDPA